MKNPSITLISEWVDAKTVRHYQVLPDNGWKDLGKTTATPAGLGKVYGTFTKQLRAGWDLILVTPETERAARIFIGDDGQISHEDLDFDGVTI